MKKLDVILYLNQISDFPILILLQRSNFERPRLIRNNWLCYSTSIKWCHFFFRDEADWFMKADDDTYVIVENLRYMLESHNASKPIYFGCKFKPYVRQGYMSGGAGYVLSKEALKRFVTQGIKDQTGILCRYVLVLIWFNFRLLCVFFIHGLHFSLILELLSITRSTQTIELVHPCLFWVYSNCD